MDKKVSTNKQGGTTTETREERVKPRKLGKGAKTLLIIGGIILFFAMIPDSKEKFEEGWNDAKEEGTLTMLGPINAKDITREFEENEAAGDAKYKGTALKITGQVSKVDTASFSNGEYILKLEGNSWLADVNCRNKNNPKEFIDIVVGSEVTVVGEFKDGGDLGVDLINCTVVK